VEWRRMANNSEEGHGPQRAVVPVMMMMMMIILKSGVGKRFVKVDLTEVRVKFHSEVCTRDKTDL
jgi:hypothetical protein